MKKIEYQAPAMEEIEMNFQGILCVSTDPEYKGSGEPGVNDPD